MRVLCTSLYKTNAIQAIYTYSSWEYATKTCTVKPQILDVNVTYNYAPPNAGTITIEPVADSLANLALNTPILGAFFANVQNSFFYTQSSTTNVIMVAMVDIVDDLPEVDYDSVTNQLFVSLNSRATPRTAHFFTRKTT